MNFSEIINRIGCDLKTFQDTGKVATYIPELGSVDPNKFGVHVTSMSDENFGYGDYNEPFSTQSIAKVLALTLAYNLVGEELWKRVGVEPSGTKFNSLIQLELEEGIPRNPLINAGAIVLCDVLISNLEDPKTALSEFIASATHCDSVNFSERIARSESETGYTNRALANLMRSFNHIENDLNLVLDFYFHLCSLEMTCKELSRTFLFLANNGLSPCSGEQITTEAKSNRINAIMQLCGFYDEAGEFAFKVGLPGKSGVGGGIVAVYPEKYSIAVWSPKLNPKGNSSKGMAFLERFTSETGTSIF
ncbi:MAG: glutaminase [Flavobacteriales bacterium]